jgi:hypothetical protein
MISNLNGLINTMNNKLDKISQSSNTVPKQPSSTVLNQPSANATASGAAAPPGLQISVVTLPEYVPLKDAIYLHANDAVNSRRKMTSAPKGRLLRKTGRR